MYVPIGGTSETLKWYDSMCSVSKAGIVGKWYCEMAEHLRKLEAGLHPPPPPKPPLFVAVNPPPEGVAKGSGHEKWWEQQAEDQQRTKRLLLFGAVGLGIYIVMSR